MLTPTADQLRSLLLDPQADPLDVGLAQRAALVGQRREGAGAVQPVRWGAFVVSAGS